MNDMQFDIISAFLDGEHVDPDALARTLAHPDARTLLADFLKLRAAANDDGRALPPSMIRLRAPRLAMWSARVPLPAAVMLALLVGAASFAVSERTAIDTQSPPAATRAVRFEPGIDWQTVNDPVARP
jgi:hypothetical protein